MATAELRLSVPVDRARDAVGYAPPRAGFTVQPTASGPLDVSRGSMGTTLVAGAFAGQDMHVRFDVHFSQANRGTLASFEHSAVGGFLQGRRDRRGQGRRVSCDRAANLTGERLAQQGLLVGGVPAAPSDAGAAQQPVATDGTWAPPVPPAAARYPGAAAPAADGSSAAPAYGATPEYPQAGAPAYGASPYGTAPPLRERRTASRSSRSSSAFVFPVGGIIAGVVALAQIKRTGEKGRGLAITGIVAGGRHQRPGDHRRDRSRDLLDRGRFAGVLVGPLRHPGLPAGRRRHRGPERGGPGRRRTRSRCPSARASTNVRAASSARPTSSTARSRTRTRCFSSFLLPEGTFRGDDAIATAAQEAATLRSLVRRHPLRPVGAELSVRRSHRRHLGRRRPRDLVPAVRPGRRGDHRVAGGLGALTPGANGVHARRCVARGAGGADAPGATVVNSPTAP